MQTNTNVDYLIIGAGPAGLQLGYYLESVGRNYLILEAGDTPGTFFKMFPRHRKLLSINKIHTGYDDPEINLRWDWNSLLSEHPDMRFTHYSTCYFPDADDLVSYFGDFARHFCLKIAYGVRVNEVHKTDRFRVLDHEGNVYCCRYLIVATGVSKPYIPPIPGIEWAEPYTTVSIDPATFVNQRVLIIGKGNSSFETADHLIGAAARIHLASPHPLTMAWQSHFVGHLRAVNNNLLDTYQLKSQNAVLDVTINRIERDNGHFVVSVSYTRANGETEDLIYDRVLVCTGFRFDDSIFDLSCRPALAIHNRLPEQTSAWESTNVKDLYFAGTLMQMRDYKKATSAFIHGFRYNIRALHRIFEEKYHNQSWPGQSIRSTPERLTQMVIDRVNTTSALWHQFGYLCDLIVCPEPGRVAHYYEEVPHDYVHDGAFGQHDNYYTVTLEYGPNHDVIDPFRGTRIGRHDVEHASQSNFLHPVIRHVVGSTPIAEHHILEDLEAEWRKEVHIEPLVAFFRREQLQPITDGGWQ
jgi:thioredoxin reductase